MRYRLCLLTALLLVLAGCSHKNRALSITRVIECDMDNIAPVCPDLFDSISFILLQIDSTGYYKTIDKVIFEDNRIYLADYSSGKIIILDSVGQQQGVFERLGRGPGEYLMMKRFAVSSDYIFVLDTYKYELLIYDKYSFDFKHSLKIPFQCDDFEPLDKGGFIFAKSPVKGNIEQKGEYRFRIIITDSQLHIIAKHYSYKPNEYDGLTFKHNLSTNGDRIIFSSFKEDGYSAFSKQDGHFLEKVVFKLNNAIPLSMRYDTQVCFSGEYLFFGTVPQLCGEYIVTAVDKPILFNPLSSKFELIHGGFLFNIIGSTKDSFIGWMYDSSDNYKIATNSGYFRADKETEAAILAGSPFLVCYHLRP